MLCVQWEGHDVGLFWCIWTHSPSLSGCFERFEGSFGHFPRPAVAGMRRPQRLKHSVTYGSHPTWHSSLNWGQCAKRNPQISVISVKLPGREAIGCDTESLLGHKQKRWLKLYNLVHFDSKLYSRFGNMIWVSSLLPIRDSYAAML